MNVELLTVGKTDSPHVEALVADYARRLNRYVPFAVTMLADVQRGRRLAPTVQKRAEGEAILRATEGATVILLDEAGESLPSAAFALWLQKRMNGAPRRLTFVVGGPYGFSEEVYRRADGRLSLSPMTFSHQIVRALFAEQLYRAFTILHGEPYHHA